ncbi:MAG: nitroreductase family protein [Desulfobulbaceae bacterium]|jgi:nitroreductase|nr:nitroreductase family protein [Desulfobulbaceae bacterium]MDY0351124.1 nitroreductase family protein [Desulfobulbaceae bacterium]
MMIADLIRATRTVRRYREDQLIDDAVLRDLVDLARLGGSAGNRQPLRYMIVTDHRLRELVFPCLGWAGYLRDWPGPAEGERPAAYIVCLLDRDRSGTAEKYAEVDLGIATQNLLLGAAEQGIYGCRIASVAPAIKKVLEVEERYRVLLVVALGYPAERVVLEEGEGDDPVRYWRDEKGVHHVPKRRLNDLLLSPGKAAGE